MSAATPSGAEAGGALPAGPGGTTAGTTGTRATTTGTRPGTGASTGTPAALPRRSRPPLLARVAESLYWAGRHAERAESLARAVLVHTDTHLDLPVGADVGWQPLLAIVGVERLFGERHSLLLGGHVAPPASGPREADVVPFVLVDTGNPSSVLTAIAALRSNVRTARAVLPAGVWDASLALWQVAAAGRDEVVPRDRRVRWLQRVLGGCAQLTGSLWALAGDDQVESFVRVGQLVERADVTARLVAARAPSLVAPAGGPSPYADVHHRAVLRSLAADEAHHRFGGAAGGEDVARFVLHDRAFSRSVASCLAEIQLRVHRWPRNGAVVGACADAVAVVSGASRTGPAAGDLRAAAFVVQDAAGRLHDRIADTYFARPAPPAATAPGSPGPGDPGSREAGRRPPTPDGAGPHGPLSDDRSGHVTQPPASPTAPRRAALGGAARTTIRARPAAPAALRPCRTTTDDGANSFRVVHRTVYRYGSPATGAMNEAHLRPRDTPTQRVAAHRLEVEPAPASSWERRDAFGNHVQHFTIRGRFDTLTVVATTDVRVRSAAQPPATPPWETVRLVLAADRQPAGHHARTYLAGSPLVPVSDRLAEFAAPSFPDRRPLLDGVVDLASRIHRGLRYEPGVTSVTTPVLEVLDHHRGVCQDFAHLAIGCLRSIGLAARYVSGYIRSTTPAGAGLEGGDASHAWFSVYLPGWGWLDVDPTNDQLVSASHVTTAWGRDYADVSPLRGTVDGGGRTQRLEVAVSVVPVPVGDP